MTDVNEGFVQGAILRRRAEDRIREQGVNLPEFPPAEDAQRLLYELSVHRLELEMQNEELRRVQQELEASRERYFDLYDLAPVGYLTLNDAGMIQEANLLVAGLLGVPRSELVAHPLSRFILPEDQDVFYRNRRQLLETRAPQVLELRMLHRDGSFFWGRLEMSLTQDANRTPACRVIVTDVTTRRQAEEEIRNLAHFPAENPTPILRIHRDGTLLYANDAARHQLVNWPLFLAQSAPADLCEASERALREGKTISATFRRGARIWSFFLIPISGADYVNCYAFDISESSQIEEAHRFLARCGTQGEKFFQGLARFLAESLEMDYVCIDRLEPDHLSARTVAIRFDGVFEDNVSYTLQDTPCGDVVGKEVCCFPAGVRQQFPKDTVLQDMKAESYVGTTLWSSTGQPIGLIAVIGRRPLADPHLAESILKLVSLRAAGEMERLDAEEALYKLNEELDHRVQARTRLLERLSARLIIAQETERKRVAQELHDSLGQSLSAAKLMGERCMESACPAGAAGHMISLQSMIKVVKDAMEEVRRISMDLRPSILDDLGLVATISWFTREFQAAYPDIRLDKIIEAEESQIPDPLKITLFRILQEAFNNAAKHSQARVIRLSLKRDANDLLMKVEDNGLGFDSHTSRKADGSGGFGLQSMKERAEFSGGTFTLASSPGCGTQITTRWPLSTL